VWAKEAWYQMAVEIAQHRNKQFYGGFAWDQMGMRANVDANKQKWVCDDDATLCQIT